MHASKHTQAWAHAARNPNRTTTALASAVEGAMALTAAQNTTRAAAATALPPRRAQPIAAAFNHTSSLPAATKITSWPYVRHTSVPGAWAGQCRVRWDAGRSSRDANLESGLVHRTGTYRWEPSGLPATQVNPIRPNCSRFRTRRRRTGLCACCAVITVPRKNRWAYSRRADTRVWARE